MSAADLEALENDLRGMASRSKLGTQASERAHSAMRAANRLAQNVGAWECTRLEAVAREIRRRPLALCVASLMIGALVVVALRRS